MKKFICIVGIIVGFIITILGISIFIDNHSKFYAYMSRWSTQGEFFNITVVCTIILAVIGFSMFLISLYKLADLFEEN